MRTKNGSYYRPKANFNDLNLKGLRSAWLTARAFVQNVDHRARWKANTTSGAPYDRHPTR